MSTPRQRFSPLFDVLFILILLMAALFRFSGLDWGNNMHLHPDERFMNQVVAALQPAENLQQYFDTQNSPLNPNNRGFSFFVYGNLPVTLVRYVAEAVSLTGYDQVHTVGRALSALADLGVVLLVYLISTRLFDRRVGLLAMAFSAVAVMQIQQSHFWTVDNFVNFFSLLAVYFAVRIATAAGEFKRADFIGFGLAFSMALACKVSLAPLALALPAAAALRVLALPAKEQEEAGWRAFGLLVLAGALSFVAFRVFQPYAFQGLGVAGWLANIGTAVGAAEGLLDKASAGLTALLGLNPHWLETMHTLAGQVNGDADWPPSMQWARRPIWFGLRNIVGWGLGPALALVCLGGLAWAGWKIVKGDWRRPPALLWAWGLLYFAWQSSAFNPTMRYFLPFYPVLVIFGAWGLLQLWDSRRSWGRPAAIGLGAIALLAGAGWAFAFSQVYQQDISRLQASRWIYQNLPGPLTLTYEQDGQQLNQPLPASYDFSYTPDLPLHTVFVPQHEGVLNQISFKYVLAPVLIEVRGGPEGEALLARYSQVVDLLGLAPGENTLLEVELPLELLADLNADYQLRVQLPAGQGQVAVQAVELYSTQLIDLPRRQALEMPVHLELGSELTLNLSGPQLQAPDRLALWLGPAEPLSLAPLQATLQILSQGDGSVLLEQTLSLPMGTSRSALGTQQSIRLEQPLSLPAGQTVGLQLSLQSGAAQFWGTAVANETSWDDGQPHPVDGYNGYGGLYQGDHNFEIYWNEDAVKLQRFLTILDESEYLFITSNRQWGSLPRLPERFPLAVAYYRALLGCPEEQSIDACYTNAQPETAANAFGFELVQVFENGPRIGDWKINDQAAEEAFTVYDHPKVFIFQKTADYDPQQWAAHLGQVDLNSVVHVTPKQAGGRLLPDLQLSGERLEQQRAGGTWAELFDTESALNRWPWLAAVTWYVALAVLGLAAYPILRWTLPGLADGGYVFARLGGLLLLSYAGWLAGSLGLEHSRGLLAAFAAGLLLLGGLAAWPQREALRREWTARKGDFLRVEALFLLFFLLLLFARFMNPDLWHPGFGGEKPMDFAYFNAVLKSSSFPPYDPWFAGGYINYYYWGFVLVGSLVKLLGIVPAVAYNLVLPSLFAMLALGAYGLAWNLWTAWSAGRRTNLSPVAVGVAAAVAVVLLGNLASFGTFFTAYARLGSEGAFTPDSGLLSQIGWMLRGLWMGIGGQSPPISLGDWYWTPTRIIRPLNGEVGPISEFPLFTFTYADLHAHMIALPVTLLSLAWAASAVLSKAWDGLRNPWQAAASLLLGALVLGSLRPINTWDLPTYLAIGVLALGYALWRYGRLGKLAPWWLAGAGTAALVALSVLAYQPFMNWYRQGYASLELWSGSHTPSAAYLNHWGIFLFFIVAWLAWETRQWLASTPLSALRKLEPYVSWLMIAFAALLFAFITLVILDVHIAWLVLPLLVWVGLLFLRRDLPEIKRMILFLVGTGLFLTLMVEVIRLQGDISRMNTVFKFYLQAWVLLGSSAALALAWTLEDMPEWSAGWRNFWQSAAALLLLCGSLFMIQGVTAKMVDRMAQEAPRGLDGMAYMQHAVYYDRERRLELSQDHAAIRWLQENVAGSPVIVEGYAGEYHWGGRISIYTGLPSVLGWNWHQRQQREFVPGNDVFGRMAQVDEFYTTTDLVIAQALLDRYQVQYIILGQMERAYYPGDGLLKFEEQDGRLWRAVFRLNDTVIYEVLPRSSAP
ncbi:MAG: glycosyltransferase family 39 protein [Anaerolineales bacterium]|nr:glycosyltransferase family 39 protein [Anaerolineales bacterium]MCW5855868.1 glycosyltransferase family 39 protein [Anaerolineales bacterium]